MKIDEYTVEELQEAYNEVVGKMQAMDRERSLLLVEARKLSEQRDVLHDALILKKSPFQARMAQALERTEQSL